MGGLLDERIVLETIFNNYDTDGKGYLSPIQLQSLHGDLRIGGVSLPQVDESLKYACVTSGHCEPSEIYQVLQEMDRRYFLLQDLRWEFSMLDRNHIDTVPESLARWFVQSVHGRHFSKKKWEHFIKTRSVPGSGVCFAEIEVMLCNIPSKLDLEKERKEEDKEKEDRLRRMKLAEEETERLKKLRDDQRKKRDEENKRLEEERRRRQLEEEDTKCGEERQSGSRLGHIDEVHDESPEEYIMDEQTENRQKNEDERRRQEEEEELRRLKDLEDRQKEEEERRKKEEEELYKDVEKLAKQAEDDENSAQDELKKNKGNKEEEEKLRKKVKDSRHRKLRYNLKVAIKARDKYQLDYNINEFKKENVEDTDMDLAKAEKLLKELTTKDNLKKAMTKREIEELEKAINMVKKHGFEVQLAKELSEASHLLTRLKRLERIRHEILELKQATVAEIRSYQNPPLVVHTVMTSTFLLLGHKEKETKIWKAVQALVGKTGKESLKRRCLECKPEKINMEAAKRAKTLLDKYDLEEVRDVSAGAATFYVWAITMIEEKIAISAQEDEQKA